MKYTQSVSAAFPRPCPTRLLLLSPAQAVGGAESYMTALAAHLREQGHEVHAGIDESSCLDAFAEGLVAAGAHLHRDRLRWRWDDSPVMARLKIQFEAAWRLFEQARPEAVFLNMNWLDAGSALGAATAAAGLATVSLFHLCPHVILLKPEERRLLRWSQDVRQQWFCVSEDNRLFLARSVGLKASRVGVIYNGPLLNAAQELNAPARLAEARADLRRELGLDPDALVMTTVGRHDVQKGLVDILPMLPGLLAEHPRLHYLWIGDGPLRERMQRLTSVFDPAGRRVTFWPHRADVPRCLGGSDLFLFPTRFEGFSLALLEAMHMGCCPVTTDVSSVREIVEDGVSGLVVRQGDARGLHQAIARLLGDPSLRRRLSAAAMATARRFSPEAMFQGCSQALAAAAASGHGELPSQDQAWERIRAVAQEATVETFK